MDVRHLFIRHGLAHVHAVKTRAADQVNGGRVLVLFTFKSFRVDNLRQQNKGRTMKRLREGRPLCHSVYGPTALSRRKAPCGPGAWISLGIPHCPFELTPKTTCTIIISLPVSFSAPVMILLSCEPDLKSFLLYSFPSSLGSNLSPAPPNILSEVFLPLVPFSMPPSFPRFP